MPLFSALWIFCLFGKCVYNEELGIVIKRVADTFPGDASTHGKFSRCVLALHGRRSNGEIAPCYEVWVDRVLIFTALSRTEEVTEWRRRKMPSLQ